MKVYRGNAAAARHYVEADHGHGHAPGHGRADDYYLADGTGLAERYVATAEGTVTQAATLDGDAYETWVAGLDPATGEPRGRLRTDDKAVRFVEILVNGPKSWSLAAALHPDIAEAYDAAQDAAATQIIGWLGEHATTRVGPRGEQVQVPVERIDAVTVRHYTSRAGDPHRHLHLQVNARVFAAGKWRGLHTVGVRDSIDAMNGIGHAAMMTNPAFRQALAAHGLTLDSETGEVEQLADYVGAFSARARQIATNIETYEAEWRKAHPDEEPGPRIYRSWDARAWAEARPDKVIPTDGALLTDAWVVELRDLGYTDAEPTLLSEVMRPPGELDRDKAVETILWRLGAKRSGWNAADIRGEAERLIARENIVADRRVRIELAEDLTARTIAACVPLLERRDVPEHIRSLTSREVLAVEADLSARMAARATSATGSDAEHMTVQDDVAFAAAAGVGRALDPAQARVAAIVAGTCEHGLATGKRLVVIEGAAGAGKTTTLAAASAGLERNGGRLVVVTPTLKAAQVASREITNRGERTGEPGKGAAFSAAWLVRRHGWRWSEDGKWFRIPVDPAQVPAEAVLREGDVLLVDEAGMLDQDTARALFILADEASARIALVGDRHQLPAVGRGGVLDLAVRWAYPGAALMLDTVRRFTDPDYAELSLTIRNGTKSAEDIFGALWQRGQVRLHPSEADRTRTLAADAAASGPGSDSLVIADTREQVADLNAAIRDQQVTAGVVDDARVAITDAGERLGTGDTIATRSNDSDLGVANRDTWTITGVTSDGGLVVTGDQGQRTLPAEYVRAHAELAYATTVYGAQGDTVQTADLVLGQHTGASSAYVGMTRGRESNTVHIVAEDMESARQMWVDAFARDRADLGPAHAAQLAATEAAKYVPLRPVEQVQAALWTTWTRQADLAQTRERWVRQRQQLVYDLNSSSQGPFAQRFPDLVRERRDQLAVVVGKIEQIDEHLGVLEERVGRLAADPAVALQCGDYLTTQRKTWAVDRKAQLAEREHAVAMQEAALATHRERRPDPVEPYNRSSPDRGGYGIGR